MTMSHLLYMFYFKLYTKNKCDIDSLIPLNRIYGKNIRMSFRLHKCGQIVFRRGKMMTTEGVELPAT